VLLANLRIECYLEVKDPGRNILPGFKLFTGIEILKLNPGFLKTPENNNLKHYV
jgi:hypothetical protein